MNINFEKARGLMVENQLRPNKIKQSKIIELFKKTPKEDFVPEKFISICYSEKDLNIIDNRGYLKNLNLAQIISSADITDKDKILHIGGLTGYLSTIIAKLCSELIIIENEKNSSKKLRENIVKYNLNNVKVIVDDLCLGNNKYSPYDVIIIDCPIYDLKLELIDQLNEKNGRLIYLKKISEELSKAYKITKSIDGETKEYLFDVFSNFAIDSNNENFSF